MAVGVVHLLEEVDIGDGDAELGVGIGGEILLDLIQHGAAVGQAGEGVGAGLPVQLLVVDGQLPLAGLYAGAEQDEVDGHHQQRYDAVHHLEDQVFGVVQRGDGRVPQGIGEQQHAEGHQPKEVGDLAPGRLVDVEIHQRQYGHQDVGAARGPAEPVDEPGQPRADDHGKADEADPRAHAVDVQQAVDRSGQDDDGRPEPDAGREKEQHHARQEIDGKYSLADEQRLAVVVGHRARLGNLLVEEIRQKAHIKHTIHRSELRKTGCHT